MCNKHATLYIDKCNLPYDSSVHTCWEIADEAQALESTHSTININRVKASS